jgi:hypothetical protein
MMGALYDRYDMTTYRELQACSLTAKGSMDPSVTVCVSLEKIEQLADDLQCPSINRRLITALSPPGVRLAVPSQ